MRLHEVPLRIANKTRPYLKYIKKICISFIVWTKQNCVSLLRFNETNDKRQATPFNIFTETSKETKKQFPNAQRSNYNGNRIMNSLRSI